MSSPSADATDSPVNPVLPDGLAEAGRYSSERDAFDHGLVVLALGIPYWLVPYEHSFGLYVEADWLATARRQLDLFDHESTRWPPAPRIPAPARSAASLVLPLLWAIVTIAVFRAQELWPGVLEDFGTLDASAVNEHHQYWRIATSLFLHADIAHLTGNLVSGFFVFSAVFTSLGRLRGAVLLAFASLAGNAMVVSLASSSEYRSLGASTAVFAGLGLLTGSALRNVARNDGHIAWRALFTPLAAGLTLLGLFGAGELHTDVAAHACGFVAGLFCGIFFSKPSGASRDSPPSTKF